MMRDNQDYRIIYGAVRSTEYCAHTYALSSDGAAISDTQHASRHHATPIYRATPRLVQQDPAGSYIRL